MNETLPFCKEAERAVIGALLLDDSKIGKVCDLISKNDFFDPDNITIFGAIEHLVELGRAIDAVTLIDFMNKNKLMKEGFEVLIYEMANEVPSTSNIEAYASIVRERSILRQLIEVSKDAIGELKNPLCALNIQEMLNKIENKVKAIIDGNA